MILPLVNQFILTIVGINNDNQIRDTVDISCVRYIHILDPKI